MTRRGSQPDSQVSGRGIESTAAGETPQPATFEEGLSRLAELVGDLEGGRLGLAESIAAYEQGVSLVRRLNRELADVEQRVQTLTAASLSVPGDGDDTDGEADSGAPGSRSRERPAAARREEPKRPANRAPRTGGGRPRSLPGMDDGSTEV